MNAQTIVFQDDFSDGFLQWQAARGDDTLWSIDESTGTARAKITTQSTLTELVPKNAFWASNIRNFEYQFEFTPLEGTDRNIGFNYQDPNNWYEIHFQDFSYNLVHVNDGLVTLNTFGNFTMKNGQTYLMKIRFENGHVQVFVDGAKIADELDWSFNPLFDFGKITLKATAGSIAPTTVEFGKIVVTSIPDGKYLNVPLFMQTDHQWRDDEYDSGKKWSKNWTFGNWGCLVTSLAMIFQYHGLHQMPDGSAVNPSTLNAWLKSQVDGYVGNGYVNWIAATRLTRLINEKFGTPKLEYVRQDKFDLNFAKSEIDAGRPVIIQIPGHFFVGDGYVGDGSNMTVKDPYYQNLGLLSQHKVAPISLRTLTPSFTDLSYLLFGHDPSLKISVKNLAGETIPVVQNVDDQVALPAGFAPETLPPFLQETIAKPAAQKYLVEVQAQNPSSTSMPFAFQAFAYDKQANPTILSQTGFIDNAPIQFVVDYKNGGSSSIYRLMNFSQFRKDLKIMLDMKAFTRTTTFQQIDQQAATAENATQITIDQKLRYITLMRTTLQQNKLTISAQAFTFLTNELQFLESTIRSQT